MPRVSENRRCGFSWVNVLILTVCILVLFAIALPILNDSMRNRGDRRLLDATHIKQIHQSWLIYARQFDGVYPTPSLIGEGEEDISRNTTANLFSACIMANFFSPELCVGPTEPSGRVLVKDDYNWDIYSPVDGVYWDDTFASDLAVESNVSYAHMPLFGENMEAHWRESMSTNFPIIGNRGPLGGVHNPDSMTYKIHGSSRRWIGTVCGADNRFEYLNTFNPTGEDNIFAWDRGGPTPGAAEDAMITFTKAMTEDGPVIQHD